MSISSSSERLDRAREIVGEILDSWRTELTALARKFVQVFLQGNDQKLTLAFDTNTIVVTRTRDGATQEIGRIQREDTDDTAILSALARLCAQNNGRDIVLEFPAHEVLHAALRMPKASRRILEKALPYELARLSPIEPERLYFDFAIERTDTSVSIELRIVKRETVDAAMALCCGAKLDVAGIAFAGDSQPANWRSFPIDRSAYLRSLWRRWNISILAILALILGLALIPAAYIRGLERADAVAVQLADAQANAELVEHLQVRARQALAESESLNRLRSAPLRVAVLDDLAGLLPDGTWITELTLEGNKLRLEGYSRSASDLIALFDRSNRFANAQFTAPLTRDAQAKVERFDLALDIREASP
jgi:general secretion pathway protein L